VHVRTSTTGGGDVKLRLSVLAFKGATCKGALKAGARRLSLPAVRTSKGKAAWKWEAASGAPRGRWKFTVTCKRGAKKTVKTVKHRVLPGRQGDGGLVFPGTLVVAVGHAVHPQIGTVQNTDGSKGAAVENPGEPGYCTWGAWNLAPWLGTSVYGPKGQNDARYWAANANRNGLPIGKTPVVGAVFVKTSGTFGHVGVVTSVGDRTTFATLEMNGGSVWTDWGKGQTNEFKQYVNHQRSTGSDMWFIYKPGTQPGAWNGHIVQWAGDTKQQKTAWLVGADGKRRWIPTSAIYNCLKGRSVPGPDILPAVILGQYPDLTGVWTSCSDKGIGASAGPPPSEKPTPTPAPPLAPTPPPAPAQTFAETVGGVAHTWTNYTNAGGTEGPTIAAYTTVHIACKLAGFRVADGNTWWYRIASSPWNGAYYVSADAFYNNGSTSGSLSGTPFVDNAVANC